MRIAQVAPLAECVPPKLYGGTERVVSWLTEELVNRGHEVTLFATGDSSTRGTLVPVWPKALRLGRPRCDPAVAQAALLEAVARRAEDFDIVASVHPSPPRDGPARFIMVFPKNRCSHVWKADSTWLFSGV
jgi:glycosyltransferase involved in cell wall biosynthesis